MICNSNWQRWPRLRWAVPLRRPWETILPWRCGPRRNASRSRCARWLASMAIGGTALRGGNAKQQLIAAYNGAGRAGVVVRVGGERPLSVRRRSDQRRAAGRFRPSVCSGRTDRRLLQHAASAVCGYLGQGLEIAAGGRDRSAPVTPADLAQFQRAAAIRDLFFAGGGNTPLVRFDIAPVSLDAGAKQATLDLDGTAIVSIHGPPRATQITWPGANRTQTVRLVFDPPPSGGPSAVTDTGPWAMFRMFGRARMKQGDLAGAVYADVSGGGPGGGVRDSRGVGA